MILKHLTKTKLGYYPEDLKPESAKKVVLACDFCNREFTKEFSKIPEIVAAPIGQSKKTRHCCKLCWPMNRPKKPENS